MCTEADLALLPDPAWFGTPPLNSDEQYLKVRNPATGEHLGNLRFVGSAEASRITVSAREAQQTWFALPFEARSGVLRRAADLLEMKADLYVGWLIRETGSVPAKAQFEVSLTVKALREAAAMPSQPQGLVLPTEPTKLSYCRRTPLGVIAVISPFNFPMYLAVRALAPALAVGNAVVLKPDTRTTVSGGLLIERLLAAAGLPVDVFQVTPGGADVGEALCTDPNVAMIQFTGSTATGRKIGALAGAHLKKVSMELGGKNSLIVLDDADLDVAASNAAWGSYLHQGQICMTTGRILVHASIHDGFVSRLTEKASAIRYSGPLDANGPKGPMIDADQASRVQEIIRDSVVAGARLEVGGQADGAFLQPTVLTGVTPEMRAFREEIFGPVAVVTMFDDDQQAATLANDTEYGLSAGIISNSVGRAMELGAKLRVGLLHINDQTVNDEVVNPFGGRGLSGNGTNIGGPANWDEFSQWQWVTLRAQAKPYPL